MSYPEPSVYDCGAPWNDIEIEDDDGNETTVCGCNSCRRRMRAEAKEYDI